MQNKQREKQTDRQEGQISSGVEWFTASNTQVVSLNLDKKKFLDATRLDSILFSSFPFLSSFKM